MTYSDLANLPDLDAWLAETDTETLRDVIRESDEQAYAGYSHEELLDLVLDWAANGVNLPTNLITREQLIACIKEEVSELTSDDPEPGVGRENRFTQPGDAAQFVDEDPTSRR